MIDRYARTGRARAGVLRRVRHALLALPAARRVAFARLWRALRLRAPVALRRPLPVARRATRRRADGVRRPRACCTVLFALLLMAVNLVFDYARIRIVVEDRRSAVGALPAAERFVRRHPRAGAVSAQHGRLPRRCSRSYALVAPGRRPDRLAIWIALLVGQIYILLRLREAALLRVAAVFFQGRSRTPRTRRRPAGLAGLARRRGHQGRTPGYPDRAMTAPRGPTGLETRDADSRFRSPAHSAARTCRPSGRGLEQGRDRPGQRRSTNPAARSGPGT